VAAGRVKIGAYATTLAKISDSISSLMSLLSTVLKIPNLDVPHGFHDSTELGFLVRRQRRLFHHPLFFCHNPSA
jgi:hypothetical protein